MPVDTRKITYAAGTQPASMGAGGQDPDPADAHQNENKPKNELQEDKTQPEPTPSPRTPTPSAHAVNAELADVESELASAKKTAEELRNRAMSRLTGQRAQPDKKSSRMPSPLPRPRMEDAHPTLDMKELGKAIGDSIKGSLDKEDIGSYISKEEAALVQCDLSLESRKGFTAMIHNKGRLADERVNELFAVFSATTGTPEERARIIEERNLKSVDKRLAATVIKCLKEKAPCVIKLTKAMEKDAALGVSGMRIFEWLNKETEKIMRMDPEDLKLSFDSTPFLVWGATKEVNEVNALEMISAIEALPTKYTSSPRDVLELILDKIPVQVSEGRALGGHPQERAPPCDPRRRRDALDARGAVRGDHRQHQALLRDQAAAERARGPERAHCAQERRRRRTRVAPQRQGDDGHHRQVAGRGELVLLHQGGR